MVDILYILKVKLLPVKGVPRKAEIIQQNRYHLTKNIMQKPINSMMIQFSDTCFNSIKWQIRVIFGARKFFSVQFGGGGPFLSLVGPIRKQRRL